MKIRHTFKFDDEDRRAIAHHYGREEKAPRADVLAWLTETIASEMEAVRYDHRLATDTAPARPEEAGKAEDTLAR